MSSLSRNEGSDEKKTLPSCSTDCYQRFGHFSKVFRKLRSVVSEALLFIPLKSTHWGFISRAPCGSALPFWIFAQFGVTAMQQLSSFNGWRQGRLPINNHIKYLVNVYTEQSETASLYFFQTSFYVFLRFSGPHESLLLYAAVLIEYRASLCVTNL